MTPHPHDTSRLPEQVDVLVVGAGPVGLSTAVILARWGVDVAVVERDDGPITQSRAVWVHPRTTELLHGMGVAEAARAEAVLMDRIDVHRGARYGGSIHYEGRGRTRFPEGMILEQSRTQRLLLDRAAELGVRPLWSHQLVALDVRPEEVVARVSGPDGDGRDVRARFVVGADGATSTVRRQVGLDLVGDTYETSFFTGDLVLRMPLHREHAHLSVTLDRTFALLPLPGEDRWRVVATVPADLERSLGRDSGPTGGPALDTDQVRQVLAGLRIEHELVGIEWATMYRSHHRVVDTFRSGRVLLAGDAAHIHSPAGGLGMNTGIGDANDLAWRLAVALRDGSDGDRLLDDYATERRSVALDVLRTSDRVFTLQAGSGRVLGALRTMLLPTVPKVVNLTDRGRRLAFDVLSQLGVTYAAAGDRTRGLKVGDRLPLTTTADGATSHDELDPARFLVIVVTGPGRDGRGDALADVVSDRGLPVTVRAMPAAAADPLGVAPGEAVLVRPDGHVWWRGDAGEPAGLAGRLDAVGLPAATTSV